MVAYLLVAPPLDGPPTGGTLYNRGLVAALRASGVELRTGGWPEAADDARPAALQLIDSLYLQHVPALAAAAKARGVASWLLLHYLPSQVRLGRAVARDELSAVERAALAAADGVMATSRFMAEQLAALGVAAERVHCVEPGIAQVAREPRGDAHVHAVVLGSVTEAKGQLALLQALARELRDDDPLQLELIGSLDTEPEHAVECRTLIAAHPPLAARVLLPGTLPHEAALARLARADLLLSVSRMESYGMALSEARAAGVPILARAAGNVAAHVSPEAGGALCSDVDGVVRKLLTLTRDRTLLAARDALARTHRITRTWTDAAAELIALLDKKEF